MKELFCLLPLLLAQKNKDRLKNCQNVPDGFQYEKRLGIYWVYMGVKRSWIEHERFCQTLDPRAHLLTVQGRSKNQFAYKRTKHNLAIGLVRLRPGKNDSWISGDDPDRYAYRKWQPNDIGKGSCVFLKRTHRKAYPRGGQGFWHRTSCDIPLFHGMCEIDCHDPPREKSKLPGPEKSRIMNEIYEDFDKNVYENMVNFYPKDQEQGIYRDKELPRARDDEVEKLRIEDLNLLSKMEESKVGQSQVNKAMETYKDFMTGEQNEKITTDEVDFNIDYDFDDKEKPSQIEKTVDSIQRESIEIKPSPTGGNAVLPVLFENRMYENIASNGESLQKLLLHGCWCPALDPFLKQFPEKGRPQDELDAACRNWRTCYNCNKPDCNNKEAYFISYTESDGWKCDKPQNSDCAQKRCLCDLQMALNAIEMITENSFKDENFECIRSGNDIKKDQCCGTAPFYKKYSEDFHTCKNNQLVPK